MEARHRGLNERVERHQESLASVTEAEADLDEDEVNLIDSRVTYEDSAEDLYRLINRYTTK